MANAPNGAVSTIARTATVSTRSPQVKPNASGIPPIAAWTVAFGVYASIVNSLSFLLRLVPNRCRLPSKTAICAMFGGQCVT